VENVSGIVILFVPLGLFLGILRYSHATRS